MKKIISGAAATAVALFLAAASEAGGRRATEERPREVDGTGLSSPSQGIGTFRSNDPGATGTGTTGAPSDRKEINAQDMKPNDVYGVTPSTGTPIQNRSGSGTGTLPKKGKTY